MEQHNVILVVDDQPIVRRLARAVLDVYRSEIVIEAADAQGALDLVSDNPEPPALLLADVNFGHGMNGIQLAQEINDRWPAMKIILMSGNHDRRHEIKPGWRFLEKPFSPAVLIEAVEDALEERLLAQTLA